MNQDDPAPHVTRDDQQGADKQTTSLHHRILSDVQDKILSGQWPPGFRIPFEHELSGQYGCSRMTVNKVLTRLVATGLIERRRKAGTFVAQPQSQSAILEIHDIAAEVVALGLPYRFELTERTKRRVTKADAAQLDVVQGSTLLDLTCRHFAGQHPFCLEQRLINVAAVPEAAEEDFSKTPPGSWLMRRVPWTTAEHMISATGADSCVAPLLGILENSACLVIQRKTWSLDQPITAVRLTYPAHLHALVAKFKPADA